MALDKTWYTEEWAGQGSAISLKTVKKVPILGDVPILGWFFRTTLTNREERELLIVVSPEILLAAANVLPRLPSDGMR